MDVGSGRLNQAVSDINMTPLIDVLLVLLVIFMVMAPLTPVGLPAVIPQESKGPGGEPLVVSPSTRGRPRIIDPETWQDRLIENKGLMAHVSGERGDIG